MRAGSEEPISDLAQSKRTVRSNLARLAMSHLQHGYAYAVILRGAI